MRAIDPSLRYAAALKTEPAERKIEDTNVHRVVRTGWPEKVAVSEIYLPADDLARVVDLAIALGLPLESAIVKSTTRAQDLLYTYDAVARLYDSQLGGQGPKDENGEPLAR